MPPALDALKARLADVDALKQAVNLMEWDQQTYMPRGGAEARAEHVGILSRMMHETLVDDATKKLLDKSFGEAESDLDAATLRVIKRDFDLATKLPAELVEEKVKLASRAHEVWVEARAANDFGKFLPYLERMFDVVRREAECLGYTVHPYDALTDQYEEGATAKDWTAMFAAIKGPQVELIRAIKDSGVKPDDSALYGTWDELAQRRFTEELVKAIGFDMERGRQDTAPHPFCTNFSVNDVRLTTRFKSYLPSAIFGSLHEAGHGMYEQGSPSEWDRTPLAGGVSLGIHESQSRTWENIVGRSRAFWGRFLAPLQQAFPAINSISLDEWVRAVNKVEPSYIRVEADEVTYNLHILIRFELECAILEGKLAVKDLPDAWNAKYAENLGITPRNDAEGCMQDVHWSVGSIGYFPTYSMGNLLSYQIWRTLERDLGSGEELIAAGKFESILGWLQEKVYSQGKRYTPKELVQRVTGKPLDPTDYLTGLRSKYTEIYAL